MGTKNLNQKALKTYGELLKLWISQEHSEYTKISLQNPKKTFFLYNLMLLNLCDEPVNTQWLIKFNLIFGKGIIKEQDWPDFLQMFKIGLAVEKFGLKHRYLKAPVVLNFDPQVLQEIKDGKVKLVFPDPEHKNGGLKIFFDC